MVSIILLSALVIGAKTYSMPSQLITFIGFLDLGITIFFLVEISIRFAGDPKKVRFFLKWLERVRHYYCGGQPYSYRR